VIVADAGVVIEALLHTHETGKAARDLLASDDVHAPHLLDLEVASVLRRLVATDRVPADIAHRALLSLGESSIIRHPHTLFLERIWELRSSVSAYDAAYVAIAERADATLVTLDRKLAAAHGPRCTIEVLQP